MLQTLLTNCGYCNCRLFLKSELLSNSWWSSFVAASLLLNQHTIYSYVSCVLSMYVAQVLQPFISYCCAGARSLPRALPRLTHTLVLMYWVSVADQWIGLRSSGQWFKTLLTFDALTGTPILGFPNTMKVEYEDSTSLKHKNRHCF